MSGIQLPNVAGSFYPANPTDLAQQLDLMLSGLSAFEVQPKALVAPHAGYIYSGPIAASAYAGLTPFADEIERVILLAPSHRLPFRGLATSSAAYFNTSLGDIATDQQAIADALQFPQVSTFDKAFQGEHALEVHLPFLQSVLHEFKLVPFIVGDATATEVSEVLNKLWGGNETLIVVSSDLSHYLDYDVARRKDQHTCEAIEQLHPEAIQYDDACGRNPLNGLLVAAREHELRVKTLDLRNSGDTAGPRDQVVGYGAWAFY